MTEIVLVHCKRCLSISFFFVIPPNIYHRSYETFGICSSCFLTNLACLEHFTVYILLILKSYNVTVGMFIMTITLYTFDPFLSFRLSIR